MIKNYSTVLIDLNNIIKNGNADIIDSFIKFADKIKSNYQIVLISNDDESSIHNLDGYFSHKIFGNNINCQMPNLNFFDKTLGIINKRPAECIFINNEPQNLLAAEEVGIAPILFNTNNQHYYGMVVENFDELYNLIGQYKNHL